MTYLERLKELKRAGQPTARTDRTPDPAPSVSYGSGSTGAFQTIADERPPARSFSVSFGSHPPWPLANITASPMEAMPVLQPDLPAFSDAESAAIEEALEERAAILEFDGQLPRPQAEIQAASTMRVYRYRLTDRPTDWLILIAPGSDLGEARRTLDLRFGSARVMEVCHKDQPQMSAKEDRCDRPDRQAVFIDSGTDIDTTDRIEGNPWTNT